MPAIVKMTYVTAMTVSRVQIVKIQVNTYICTFQPIILLDDRIKTTHVIWDDFRANFDQVPIGESEDRAVKGNVTDSGHSRHHVANQ
jgi:hypothetical protein